MFREGSDERADDLLYIIEQAPYQGPGLTRTRPFTILICQSRTGLQPVMCSRLSRLTGKVITYWLVDSKNQEEQRRITTGAVINNQDATQKNVECRRNVANLILNPVGCIPCTIDWSKKKAET